MRQRGFTVIELIIVISFLVIAGSIFLVQKRDVTVAARDSQRKVAINAMYYALEQVYYKDHAGYPKALSAKVLPSVDPDLFKDPDGKVVGSSDSSYRYEPTGCSGDSCKGYVLKARLEKESDFIRSSDHN